MQNPNDMTPAELINEVEVLRNLVRIKTERIHKLARQHQDKVLKLQDKNHALMFELFQLLQ